MKVIASETKSIVDNEGTVTLRLEYIEPREMILSVMYYGYLNNEGPVNFYIDFNGQRREFMTMKTFFEDRRQLLKIISFNPLKIGKNGVPVPIDLPDSVQLDHLLFNNAYFANESGINKIEIKFFANSKWDGDGNRDNANYEFYFACPCSHTS
ncbi:MAG: hypothetical protein GX221_05555 [Candidatus Riflebacteria bacterium]|nr:hypothetical protein [Candidatus Riflebacteria bacterium]